MGKILQQKDIVKLKKRLSSQGIVVNEDMQDALDTLSPNTKAKQKGSPRSANDKAVLSAPGGEEVLTARKEMEDQKLALEEQRRIILQKEKTLRDNEEKIARKEKALRDAEEKIAKKEEELKEAVRKEMQLARAREQDSSEKGSPAHSNVPKKKAKTRKKKRTVAPGNIPKKANIRNRVKVNDN